MDDDQQQYPSTATEQKMRKRAVTTTVAVNLSRSSAALSKYDLHKAVQKAREEKRDTDDPDSVSEGGDDDSDKDKDFVPSQAEFRDANNEEDDDEVVSDDEDVTVSKKKKKSSRNVASDSSYRPDKSHLNEQQKRAKKKRESNATGAGVKLNTPIVPSPTKIRPSRITVITAANDSQENARNTRHSRNNDHDDQFDGDDNYDDGTNYGAGGEDQNGEDFGEDQNGEDFGEDQNGEDSLKINDLSPSLRNDVRHLLTSDNAEDEKFQLLLSVILERTGGMRETQMKHDDELATLREQLRILIGLKGQNKIFFVFKGDSNLFTDMVTELKRFLHFPMYHLRQVTFLEKILDRFPLVFFVLVSKSKLVINYLPSFF
jgi:hypothetical protein